MKAVAIEQYLSIEYPESFLDVEMIKPEALGHKPKSLSHAESAALPSTTITAYEALFE